MANINFTGKEAEELVKATQGCLGTFLFILITTISSIFLII